MQTADTLSKTAAQDARERYAAIGAVWMARFNVTLSKARTGLHGCAHVETRKIEAPWPTTSRKRLYILAHEIGHVALDHRRKLPTYVQEFEAEQFAAGLMRASGVAVPRAMTDRAKRYIRTKIGRAHARFVRWVDPDIAAWAGTNVGGINWSSEPKHQKDYYGSALKRVASALAA